MKLKKQHKLQQMVNLTIVCQRLNHLNEILSLVQYNEPARMIPDKLNNIAANDYRYILTVFELANLN